MSIPLGLSESCCINFIPSSTIDTCTYTLPELIREIRRHKQVGRCIHRCNGCLLGHIRMQNGCLLSLYDYAELVYNKVYWGQMRMLNERLLGP